MKDGIGVVDCVRHTAEPADLFIRQRALAHVKADTSWRADDVAASTHQLKSAAMLPIHDVHLACQERLRAVRAVGAVGSFVRPNLVNGHFWPSTYWDPLYTMHEELG